MASSQKNTEVLNTQSCSITSLLLGFHSLPSPRPGHVSQLRGSHPEGHLCHPDADLRGLGPKGSRKDGHVLIAKAQGRAHPWQTDAVRKNKD